MSNGAVLSEAICTYWLQSGTLFKENSEASPDVVVAMCCAKIFTSVGVCALWLASAANSNASAINQSPRVKATFFPYFDQIEG